MPNALVCNITLFVWTNFCFNFVGENVPRVALHESTGCINIMYSTRIEELIDSREAISGKRLGFMMKFFTTKCTYRCTILFKVLEPFRWIHFFFCKKFFFSFLTILTRKITPKKIPLRCMLVRHIYTNFFFCWRFSANFCAYGTQNSKNTKSGISH